MNYKLSILFLLLLFPLSLLAVEEDTGYHINSWKYEAQVHYDNTWTVKETLDVTYSEERHGIFRYIPRNFALTRANNGGSDEYNYHVIIDSVDVKGYMFEENDADDSQDNLIIKIGDANKTLTGRHTYVITYTLHYPDDRYAQSDDIYHSVLGTEVTTYIGLFSFRIDFDKALPRDIASLVHVYSGAWGSNGNDLNVQLNANQHYISGTVTDIAPGNGITLRAELPEGFYEGAYTVGTTWMYLFLAIAVILFILALTYLVFHRRERPVTVIEYSAPDGISSAEVGVIIDSKADLSDLTSLIVWFASKGYLKITEKDVVKHTFGKDKVDLELTKLKDLPKDAPHYQKQFWDVFFKDSDSVVLSKLGDKHVAIGAAMESLAKYFSGKRKLTHIHWLSLTMTLLYIVFGVFSLGNSSAVEGVDDGNAMRYICFWAIPILIVIFLRIICSNYDMLKGKLWKMAQIAVISIIGVADIALLWFSYYNAVDYNMPAEAYLAVLAGGWILAMFSGRIMRDSQYRKEKMSLLLGFREFIEKSELPMLKAQVDENPSYFYDVLPYAMVFGLTKKWQSKFKELDVQKPDWYECSGSNVGTMTGLMMASRLSDSVTHSATNAIAASSHDPSTSSSSSFGGFSGGGGGGGGCGSW